MLPCPPNSKKLFLVLLLSLGFLLLYSQTASADWSKLNGNLPGSSDISTYVFEGNLYVVTAGSASNTTEVHRWEGGSWTGIGTFSNTASSGFRLTSYQGDLYVAMADTTSGNEGTKVHRRNADNNWPKVGNTFNTGDGQRGVGGFVEWDNRLWVTSCNNVTQNAVFVWDGGTWTPRGQKGTDYGEMGLLCPGDLIVFNGELHYSSGGFSYFNTAVYKYIENVLGEWAWTRITECTFLEPGVYAGSMTVYDGQLHYVIDEGPRHNVYKYNPAAPSPCNSERVGNSGFANGRIVDILSLNGYLFALADNLAGDDDMEVWIYCPGGNWYQVGSGFGKRNTTYAGYQSLTGYGGVLNAGGYEGTDVEQAVYSYDGDPAEICAGTCPDPPTLISPTDGATNASTNTDLVWTHSGDWGINRSGGEGGREFEVYFGTDPNPPLFDTVSSSTTSKAVTVDNNTTYYWKVVADNGALTASSPVWSFTPTPCLQRSPSTLSFTATEGGSNPSDQNINVWNSGGGTLLWGSSDDQSSPNWLLTTDASLTSTVSIDISGLSVGTYNGTVTLFCDSCPVGDCQEKTVPVTLTVNPPCIDTAPDAPTLSSPSNGATGQSTSPTLDWNDISSWGTNCAGNDNDYEVLLDTNSNPTTSRGTEPGGSTSKLISGLDPGTTYYWKVRASNGVLSSDSPIWSFTTEPLPCLERSPSSLSFSATEGGSNPSAKNISISNSGGGTLSWGSSDDQSSPNWLLTTDASLTSTVSINISGLSAGTYNGTVTLSCSPLGSCQAGSCQQKTTSVTLTVNPGNSPPYVHTPSPGDGATNVSYTTDLSWIGGDPDPGDTVTYDVYFEAGDSTPDVLVSNNQSGTSYDPGTLNFSTLYYWKVVASDGSLTATGPPTGSWSFTTEDPPCLGVSPSSLSFTATVGTNPSTREIDVWNDGGGILLWGSSAEDGLAGDDWLVPVDGTGIVTVSIDIESTSLGAGEYTGTVTIACDASCPCATVPSSCESQDVAVTLTVTQATASISGEVWLDTGANAGDGNWDADEIAYTTTTLTLSRGGGNTVDTVSGGYDFGSFSISPPEAVTVTLDINTLPSGWGGTGVEFSDGTDCGTASTSCLVTLNNGDSRVINFGIWGVPSGWFQVIDGDIHSEGDIDNPVP